MDGPKFRAKVGNPASATLKLMPGNGGSIKRKSLHEEIRISIFVCVTFLLNFWRENKKKYGRDEKIHFFSKMSDEFSTGPIPLALSLA